VRLFTAIDLSRATRDAIAVEQRRIAKSLGRSATSLKWIRADQAHVTLVFLGEIDAPRVPALLDALNRDVDAKPFEIAFGSTGVFPSRGAPRVLWAGIQSGLDALGALQREIAARIVALEIPVDVREFRPHLTLGRWPRSQRSDGAPAVAAARHGVFARELVQRATLFESRLSSSGAAYTALAHANLTRR
jgi:RNA 2',3'-cyclic 3'-phosphodiesterase